MKVVTIYTDGGLQRNPVIPRSCGWSEQPLGDESRPRLKEPCHGTVTKSPTPGAAPGAAGGWVERAALNPDL